MAGRAKIRKVIHEPRDEWSSDFIAALGSWSEEVERPQARAIAKKKDRVAGTETARSRNRE
jgi:hypothetical protein